MKKYLKISLVSIVPLMMHAAENSTIDPKKSKRISPSCRRVLASSDGAIKRIEPDCSGRDLAKSLPINVPATKTPQEKVEIFTFSPCTYFCFGAIYEKNSYTPTDTQGSGR